MKKLGLLLGFAFYSLGLVCVDSECSVTGCFLPAKSLTSSPLHGQVAKVMPLSQWADNNNVKVKARDNLFMVELQDGSLAVFKANKEVGNSYAEVAFDNAAKWLGLDLTLDSVVREINIEGVNRSGVLRKWAWPLYPNAKDSNQLKEWVGEDQYNAAQVLYFVLGQYDRHFGNQVVYNDNAKIRLALIDNSAIVANQFVQSYGSLPWVEMAEAQNLTEDQPATIWESLQTKQNPEAIFAQFSDFDIYTNRDISNGFAHIWNGILWRQFYATSGNLGPAFADKIDSGLLNKLKALDAETVKSFWQAFPAEWDEASINAWVNNLLERRDMVVQYFEQHPEGIVS